MGRSARKTLLLCVLLVGALVLASCGGTEAELEAPEGEPVELGPLSYNVQITRFLNPHDAEDDAYLFGQPDAGKGNTYLGVFLTIENESDVIQNVPQEFELVDTRENTFPASPSESPFALELGQPIAPLGEVPEPGTAAASGPIGGSMLLFLIEESVAENRPLKLEIPARAGPSGAIELDI
jgi:hypothetical protein